MAGWVWDVVVLVAVYAMNEGRRDLARAAGALTAEARCLAARYRARRAFWRGLGLLVDSMDVTEGRARQLAAAQSALHGRHPFLQASGSSNPKITFGLL